MGNLTAGYVGPAMQLRMCGVFYASTHLTFGYPESSLGG